MGLHTVIQRILTGMTKRCVPQIVRQGNGLDKILIDSQRPCNGPAELGDLQRMCQAGTKQISLVVEKNLGFVHKTAERGGVHDAVTVTLELGTGRRRRLNKAPATRQCRITGIRRKSTIYRQITPYPSPMLRV
jgi:hypothetical protein